MRRGTPNFVGERLIEARESRRRNRSELAEDLKVGRETVRQWETVPGRTPSSQMMDLLADRLHFPVHRFLIPVPERKHGTRFFRSMAAATKRARVRAHHRHGWVKHDICGYLRSIVQFPTPNFPTFDLPGDPAALSPEDIDHYAQETRRFWNLGDGPISDVVLLLENNGAVVTRQELEASKIDAFSEWCPTDYTPYFILNSDKMCAVRSRFDAAHELGHIVLHRHVSQSQANDAALLRDVFEVQADRFASAFLMPATSFGDEAIGGSIQSFVTMKPRWRVSIAAMIMRSRDLGLITDRQLQRLMIYRAQKGWTTSEPWDTEWKPEVPRFLRRSLDLILKEGLATRMSLESDLALMADDIEKAIGVETGFLDEDVEHYKFPKLIGAPPEPEDHETLHLFGG